MPGKSPAVIRALILTSGPVPRPNISNMHHRTKFREHGSNRPPSWICFTRVGTTHVEYLVVFVTVQNLVAIGAVISIVCKF